MLEKECWYGPNCSVFRAKLASTISAMAYRRTYKPKVEDNDTSELLKLRNTSVEKTIEKLFADLRQTTRHTAKNQRADRPT
jgi:hypothetical protein